MPPISFKAVAEQIDPLYPPTNMKDLLSRFRYPGIMPGTVPPTGGSFREVGARLTDKGNRQISFLHYNTWLLKASFDLKTFIKAIGGLGHFVVCVGLGLGDVVGKILQEAGVDLDRICDKLFPPVVSVCGVSVNPMNDGCKLVSLMTKAVGKVTQWIFDAVGASLEDILDFLDVSFDAATDIVLKILGLDPSLQITSKPEMDSRSTEIGEEVPYYGWVSLCEVWTGDMRRNILKASHLPSSMPVFDGPPGPQPGEWQHLGSGLMAFSPKLPLRQRATHVYQKKGVSRKTPGGCDFGAFVDSDKWAKKGVQLTVLDCGVGKIELYSTHLYSGGDMIDAPILDLPAPTGSEKAAVRAAQIRELVNFISTTHDPRNVAMIAGDFNIAATSLQNTKSEYANLVKSLRAFKSSFHGFAGHRIAFDDWWTLPVFQNVFPKQPPIATEGHTNRHGDGDGTIYYTFDSVCKVFPRSSAKPDSSNKNDYYCDEKKPHDKTQTGARIDYIFVERPTVTHTFMLDVSRIRRRAFKRRESHPAVQVPNPIPGGPPITLQPQLFLSDHMGLEVSLFASHKTHVP